MVDIIKNNFLGVGSKDKLKIFRCFQQHLEVSSNVDILSEFSTTFSSYISHLEEYTHFTEHYMEYNSVVNRYIRGMILQYLYHKVEEHHVNYNDEHVKGRFNYYSDDFFAEDKENEFKRYFEPLKVDTTVVDGFLATFDDLSSNDKNDLIEDFCYLYTRIREFHFPIPQEEVDDFESIIHYFLGDDVVGYYKKLYPTEKMMFIKTLSSSFCCLDKKGIVNNEDPKYVRKLKNKLDEKVGKVFK